MARRKTPSDFSASGVTRIVDRLGEEQEKRRAGQARRYAPKPVTLATGRWVRCPDCRDVVQARKGCVTCGGSGDIPETKEALQE